MSNDTRINFLKENGWDWNFATHKGSHPYITDDEFIGIEEAMSLQETYDPESVRDLGMIENLNSRHATMYSSYMES